MAHVYSVSLVILAFTLDSLAHIYTRHMIIVHRNMQRFDGTPGVLGRLRVEAPSASLVFAPVFVLDVARDPPAAGDEIRIRRLFILT
jgi:hypothetical protein